MENKVLQKNIETINSYDNELANKILMFSTEKSNFSFCQTEKSEYNVVFKGVPLHSEQGAIEEAEKITQNFTDKKNSIKIIYGLGLGYLADVASNKIVQNPIIIYEPEIEILFFVLSLAQIDALYKKNVFICNNKEAFKNLLNKFLNDSSDISISFLPTYKKMYEDDINEIIQLARQEQGSIKGSINTIIKKSPKAIVNTFRNVKYLTKIPNINEFKDIYKGKTALIVAAGPSLKENIEKIKENKDKYVIFCVSVALKALLEADITPDFILDIETSEKKALYQNLETKNSYFILEAFADSDEYNIPCKGKISYISQDNFLNNWLRNNLGLKDDLKSYGTVSYVALYCAFIMGFDQIILIGQDLAYRNGRCYSEDSQLGDIKYVFNEEEKKYVILVDDVEKTAIKAKGNSSETSIKSIKNHVDFLNKNLVTVKSQDGNYLPTQVGYMLFINWFSACALELKEKNPNIVLINSSLGGAQIDNWENKALDEAIKDTNAVEKVELNIKEVENAELNQKFKIDFKIILKDIVQYEAYATEALKLAEKIYSELKIKKVTTDNILKNIKKHNDYMSKILHFNKGQIYNIIFVQYSFQIIPIIENVNISNFAEHLKMFELLVGIYKKIVKHCKVYKQLLEKEIEIL